ncbi:MAG: 16S rRNA (uracil(1498)-N(3))-methyltransferase, partial [Opitutaceae bacterium]|nr:16S rRNA (uracil(1498)-N(3))-methyltransferase [Opitutaceae bacterium]
MNLVLFEPGELDAPLPAADPRAQHILKVLRRAPGDTFVAGVVDGPLGDATLRAIDPVTGALHLSFAVTQSPPPLPPVTLVVGLPRPQTARDLLRDATTLGVSCIHFVRTERSDPNY